MVHKKIARRYAKGLADFIKESGNTEQLMGEMKNLKDSIRSNEELRVFFKSPIIDKKKKIQIAEVLFSGYSEAFKKFISLVINHNREFALADIAEEFIIHINQENGLYDADLVSAAPLPASLVEEIAKKAKEAFQLNYSLNIHEKVDPSLLGGFIFRIGNNQIDSSLKTKFEKLKKDFSKNLYEGKY